MYKKIIIVFTSVLLLANVSCLSPVKMPQINTYTLTTDNIDVKSTQKNKGHNGVLLVSMPVASPGYQTTDMIYVQHPYQLSAFTQHRWIATPSEMLMPLLIQSLQRSGYFKAVVSPSFVGMTNFVLDTQLITLKQEFFERTSQVCLVISANLLDNTTHKVIAHQQFEAVAEAPENNPYSGVVAANRAATKILSQINAFVISSIHKNR